VPDRRGLWLAPLPLSRRGLSRAAFRGYQTRMNDTPADTPAPRADDRAARLAQHLRENLRKRKAQARGAGNLKPLASDP
jgi:hypothetical protein